ncbi:P-loop containing nucleoside triphosphate hydrolase protein [Rhizophagus irregularis]|uniref:P-loop containing nucleoside triphosphate hydrolase protein n=1 Tax=Rhizophagus irregularis TaxID=588596 RepID=A0A2N0QRK2_9GLOM|nr:P-loop containing nucleoside triphosphate hydrolase protein [Rhizophagus irregularis]
MKEICKLQDIQFEIKDNRLFENVSCSIHQGDIIGIIGKNGAGKSTLLQMIKGEIQPTKGHIQWLQDNITTSFVEQEKEHFTPNELNTEEAALLSKWHVPANEYVHLSGGEKLKARLAKGFTTNANLLLLDEPTNHLDEEGAQLLIEEIKQYKGTVILVSHDRYFLDKVVTKIWSIENKKLIEHTGHYTSYMKEREQKRLSQKRAFEKQQKMIAEIESQINELSSWSEKAHRESTKKEGFKEFYRVKAKRMDTQIKSKRKRLEKELEKEKIERVDDEYEVHFTLKANEKRGKRFLEVKSLKKTFGKRTLFEDVNFTILHGEKIALVGSNENTPEELFHRESFEEQGKVRNLLKHLGFSKSAWTQPIQNMSMGERVKCKLMLYILEEKDVLILDEPTNHLDLPSREQLERTLETYNGTLIVVSHDRYFIEKTTNHKLEIKNKSVVKVIENPPEPIDNKKEQLLKYETERQEVLGKLSFMTPKDAQYLELDQRFKELTKKINELK